MALHEAEHGLTDMAMNNGRFHGDESLLVRFFKYPRHSQTRSELEGRPIYLDTDYIEIMQPGNKDSIIKRPATDMDKRRFPEHYRKYQAREDQEEIEGTLLEDWPAVTRSQVEELKYLNIRTVEQLATAADVNIQNLMGVGVLKNKAAKYLETAKDEAIAEKFAALEAKYEALLAEKEPETHKKRGRPKKDAEE
jgi:hypothetical protein